MNSTGLRCFENPKPVNYCKTYDQNNNCNSCRPYSYLNGSTCVPVNSISNCLNYEAADKCSKCASGYQISENMVVIGDRQFQNSCFKKRFSSECLLESEVSVSCLKCEPTYKRVKNQDETYSCLQIVTENCELYQEDTCKKCKLNYYLDETTCKRADGISNCAIFANKSEC